MFRYADDPQGSFYNHDGLWDTLIPNDSVFRLFREFAPILIQPDDFVGRYSLDNGRPSHAALRMTLACLLQQMLNETDRGMEVQTRVNLEVKYALGMALDDPGIDHANFSVHRQRLMDNGLDQVYLERFTRLLYYLDILTGKEPWLTDTTHAIAPISAPTTIELIRQAMRLIVRLLEKSYRIAWRDHAIQASRYRTAVEEIKEHHLDEGAKQKRLAEVVHEADELLAFLAEPHHPWHQQPVVHAHAQVLQRILQERIVRHEDGSIRVAPPGSVKDILASAVDPQARFGCKGKTKWRGYKVASVEIGNSGFVAAADAIKANAYDGSSMELLASQLPTDIVENPVLVGDMHYGAGKDREAMKAHHITVVAPLSSKVKCAVLDAEGFQVSDDHTALICPNGKRITSFNDVEDGRNFNITAKTYGCKHCPHYTTCFKGKKKRTVFVHHAFDTLLEAARHAQTDTYREQMRLRGRIEAKQNELLHHYGLRRVRYWGQRKLAFAARMKALGANLNKLNRRCWDKKNPLELDMHTARSITFKKVA